MNKKIISAVISGVIAAVLGYVGSLTNIFDINWTQLLNIAILTAITSYLKAISTTNEGKILGVQIK